MRQVSDNRAVSALFRIFGGKDACCRAEDYEKADWRGMHRFECAVLGFLVPLTVWVAIAEWFVTGLGKWAGVLLALPVAFLALSFLSLVPLVRSSKSQWRFWLSLMVVWGFFRIGGPSIVNGLAWTWAGIFSLNAVAVVLLGLRKSMEWTGSVGIVWRIFLFVSAHAAAVAVGFHWNWQWALLGALVISAMFCWSVLNPYCQWLGPVRLETGDDETLITIDDGPDPRDTPVLLDLLDAYQAKAVFFMIGEKVRAHPDLAREVLRRGHEIGNHTMTHPSGKFWALGPVRTRREIADCQNIIFETTGFRPRWFRAPVGHRNLFTHPIAGEFGLEVMGWNRRGFDAIAKDPEPVLARILPKLSKRDIVLLHEATPVAEEVLEGVLVYLAERSSRFF